MGHADIQLLLLMKLNSFLGGGWVGDWKEKWAGKKTNRCDSDEVKENVKESRKSQERESAVYYDCSGVVKARKSIQWSILLI